MLSREDNELITRTGRGTPMGEVFRRFWLPAILASELPAADCAPVKFKLLGEELVAFRDTSGRPGIISAYCPHRGAPMCFARNEDNGLRCVYHGLKFDITGQCVDMPHISHGDTVKQSMRTIAYPAAERGKLIWVYMGPPDRQPPLPGFPYFELEPEKVWATKYEINCNWLQGLEGDLDPSHFGFVHSILGEGGVQIAGSTVAANKPTTPIVKSIGVANTKAGVVLCRGRVNDEGNFETRAQQFILPIFSNSGLQSPGVYSCNIRVPIDDEHEWHYRLRWTNRGFTEREVWEWEHLGFVHPLHEEGSWRPMANRDNNYRHDPILQHVYNYSGVIPFATQDIMVTENQWGAIQDRTKEHLLSSDREIVFVRRRLLKMAKDLAGGKEIEEPFLLDDVLQEYHGDPQIVAFDSRLSSEQMDHFVAAMHAEIIDKNAQAEEEADAAVMWAAPDAEQSLPLGRS